MKQTVLLSIAILLAACSSAGTVKEPFTVSLKSPKVNAGTIEAQFDKFLSLGGLKKQEITVDYYPGENAVCLQYRIEFYTYYQFWDRNSRAAFVTALEKYKEDYAQRNFGKNSRKTKQNYGIHESYLIWQMAEYTAQANNNTDVEVGYYFKEKVPYFTLTQRETYTIDVDTRTKRECPEIMIYFTRAQADVLAAFFDQEYLRALAASNEGKLRPKTPADSIPEMDSY